MAAAAMSSMSSQGQGLSRLQGTVLVVDDEESIRNLFRELFRSERINVRVAGSRQEAVAMVKQMAPTLMIVDVLLPDGTALPSWKKYRNWTIGSSAQ